MNPQEPNSAPANPASPRAAAPWLAGAGETGARLRAFDWASTSLGPVDRWPQSLRIAVGICMNSRFPMFVWWGPDLINIYNDAYIPVLGKRHPAAFGLPAAPTWHEIWHVVGPQADAVMRRGEATWNERVLLVMERNGFPEDTWFTWSYSPIPDESGGVGGLFCACVEDTSWVLAERKLDSTAAELAETRARLESTLAAAEIGTWTWDLRADRVVADVNLARLFGVSTADAAGGPIDAYVAAIHPDDRAFAQARIADAIRHGDTFEAEYRLLATPADGRHRHVIARGRVERDQHGVALRLPGVVVDVTERYRAEEALREAAEAAEAANQAKDRFLAVLSHELRTPLSPVVMTVAATALDPDLPEKFRDDLAMVRRNIDLEVKLIDDLLDLSRVTSGKLRLHMEPVHAHEVLGHAIQNSLSDSSGKRLVVRDAFDARTDLVTADPARLQQVFWNLLRNAVKFTPEGGDIAVRTWNDDGRLHVEVRDTGAGIPPEVLARIFDAFEQGDARVTRQFGGLGLGLAIAKAVVEMHGGQIAAASDGVNRGAAFTVTLDTLRAPAPTRPAAIAPSPRAADAPPGGGTRILLVEDHPDTARMLARLLKHVGYDVRTANTVAAALQLADAHPFDVVVSDIGLPDATGYELMAQLRDRHGMRGIALTGYGLEEDTRKSRDAGFAEHVVKPVNLTELQAVIRRVAQGAP